MWAFTRTELDARDDEDIPCRFGCLDNPADLVVIGDRNPRSQMPGTGEKRGDPDCGIRITRVNMHVHRGISLFPDRVKEGNCMVYGIWV